MPQSHAQLSPLLCAFLLPFSVRRSPLPHCHSAPRGAAREERCSNAEREMTSALAAGGEDCSATRASEADMLLARRLP